MSRNRYATQGACIVAALRTKAHTYAEMHRLGVSTSPQKRVAEYLRLHPELKLVKGNKAHGCTELVTWRVVKA
jgi:hypothetical protein